MRKILVSLLLLAPVMSLASCWAVAVGGAAVLISQDTLDNQTYAGQVNVDSRRVWATVKSSLSHMSVEPISTDEDLKTAEARIDGALVTVTVETHDLNRSMVLVSAKKWGVWNGQIADNVFRKILEELNE